MYTGTLVGCICLGVLQQIKCEIRQLVRPSFITAAAPGNPGRIQLMHAVLLYNSTAIQIAKPQVFLLTPKTLL